MIQGINRLRKRLFTKLLLIFFLTAVTLVLLLAASLHLINREPDERVNQFQRNLSQYSDYLIADIGQPPEPHKLESISRSTGLEIYIESGNQQWGSAGADLQRVSDFRYSPLGRSTNAAVARQRGSGVLRLERPPYTYYFVLERQHADTRWSIILTSSALIILFVIGVAYTLVRRLFKPIHQLRYASQQVAEGDLDVSVNRRSDDELGELTSTFNEMVATLKQLIHSKDQLLLDVSHELRSPLTRMKIATEMLKDSKTKVTLQEDIGLLERLITDILESARLEDPDANREDIELEALLRGVCEKLGNSAPGVALRAEGGPFMIRGDTTRLGMAFGNLVENGLKFSGHQARPVEVLISSDSGQVSTTIRDYGIGMNEGDVTEIFEPFSRLDRSRDHKTPGFGLGLNIAQRIVQAHAGSISVDTHGGELTEFVVQLPRVG